MAAVPLPRSKNTMPSPLPCRANSKPCAQGAHTIIFIYYLKPGFPRRFHVAVWSRAGHAPPLQMTRKFHAAALPRPYIQFPSFSKALLFFAHLI